MSRSVFQGGFYLTDKGIKYRRRLWMAFLPERSGLYTFYDLFIAKPIGCFMLYVAYHGGGVDIWLIALFIFFCAFASTLCRLGAGMIPCFEIDLEKQVIRCYSHLSHPSIAFANIDFISIEENPVDLPGVGNAMGTYLSLCSIENGTIVRIIQFNDWARDEIEMVKSALTSLIGKNLPVKYTVHGKHKDYAKDFFR